MNSGDRSALSRRDFVRAAGAASLASAVSLNSVPAMAKPAGKYNILMIVTDQERRLLSSELPTGYRLPGHEKLAARGVTFENHQIASNVCTPSRSVLYTGLHIQNNGMFDNTNFPWASDLSTDIPTIGSMLQNLGYYAAYKGKWHLTDEFETANKLHAPTRLLGEEMAEYGFEDYFGIGDIIAHTDGGFMHDGVIASMTRSWLRGKARQLAAEDKPWFMAVNLVNPHDVMYYNTDRPGDPAKQATTALMRLNREPATLQYQKQWDVKLPESRKQSTKGPGRPAAHEDYIVSRAALVGRVPNEDQRWRELNNYYLNCIQDVDTHVLGILNELDDLGFGENTVVMYTADHGEMAGAHGLSGKGATGYREQNNVPFIVSHPAYEGNKRCKAVTSHVDIAATLVGLAGGKSAAIPDLPGHDITPALANPERASHDAIRPGALFNFNMFAYADGDFLSKISEFIRGGGNPQEIGKKGWKPDLRKRGAVRSVYDGRYKLVRYFSPTQHHVPASIEQLFANNDVELFDVKSDPLEMQNLATDRGKHADLIAAMNDKLNALIAAEVGDDMGQMLPGEDKSNWQLDPSVATMRM